MPELVQNHLDAASIEMILDQFWHAISYILFIKVSGQLLMCQSPNHLWRPPRFQWWTGGWWLAQSGPPCTKHRPAGYGGDIHHRHVTLSGELCSQRSCQDFFPAMKLSTDLSKGWYQDLQINQTDMDDILFISCDCISKIHPHWNEKTWILQNRSNSGFYPASIFNTLASNNCVEYDGCKI